jgi:hypothetical protein
MKTIILKRLVGVFAEDKDKARDIRIKKITPMVENKKEVTLDFKGVEATTQSFIHALISEVLRDYGPGALDLISFKNCNPNIKKVISIVVEYMQV